MRTFIATGRDQSGGLMTIARGRTLPLVWLVVVLGGGVAHGTRGAQSASPKLPPDACARLTRAEAAQVLGAPVGEGRVRTHDMATECRYDTAGDTRGRLTLAFDVYETGRAGLDGSAAAYFAQVRRGSGHMGLRLEAVPDVGDEAYWMRGVLNVRQGEDLALAIEVSGAGIARPDNTAGEPTVDPRALALSKTAAAIILRKANAASSARTRTGETLTIQSNTQAHLQDLRIGVGNIWEEAYTPEGGQPTRGLTAMLQIVTSDGASARPRVHVGQTLHVSGYVIRVLSITPARVSLTVAREPER
ncbi:MAG: hypothetical protein GEV06_07250 [Luteitalea sp.]|nr:hypothetical protein [Luteitalea sp.]